MKMINLITNKMRHLFLVGSFMLFVANVFAQLSVTQIDENTAADIITGQGVIWTSSAHSGGADQLARFEVVGTSPIGITSGIVLTTGRYTDVGVGNTGNGKSSSPLSQGGSAALCAEHPGFGPNPCNLNDMTELSVSFIATSTSIEFQIVFASEEYLEYINDPFQDVMGVYMQGLGLSPDFAGYENISIIPGTNDFVSIGTVNTNSNPSWYVNNPYPSNPYPIEYDGFTVPMTILVDNIQCGASYNIVFALANVADAHLESALFIGANSIKTDFIVDDLTIVGPQPFCEGEDINALVNNNPNWNYSWSTGQAGLGLSSITTPAIFGDNSISVTITDPDGCIQQRSEPIEVHTNNNQPPSFLNMPEKLYVSMGDTICYEFHSTDSPNEKVDLSYASIFPNPNVYSFDLDIEPGLQYPAHDRAIYCATFMNFWDYGEYAVKLKLTDNNACGQNTVFDEFVIDVLCPSCPECLEIDHREDDFNPLFDGTVDAAKCLKIGTNPLPGGHGVNTDNYAVDFRAGESIEFGPGWEGGSNWSALVTGNSCSNQCNDCCTYDSELSFDPPQEPFVLSPNNDGFNDVFFISDLANPFNAYRSTFWELQIWPYSLVGWYPLGQIIWSVTNIGNTAQIEHPITPICSSYETPTQQHPYKTFWWDATIGIPGLVFIHGDAYNANVGELVPPGLYKYEVTIDGCQIYADNPGFDQRGHNLNLEGIILVLPSTMASISGTGQYQTENEQVIVDLNNIPTGETPNMIIYPNPTTNKLFVALTGVEDNVSSLLEVFNLAGQLVIRTNTQRAFSELELGHLQKGVYYIKVTNDQSEFIEKIVLQ
jgi:Secretion system C-terminal sorting domain